jgi:hypothetical protein
MRLLAAVAALGLLGMTSGMALAGEQDFTLVNRTGYQIDDVYVGPHSSSSWGKDIMGKGALGDGETVKITFAKSKICNWDLKVKYHDEEEAIWESIDLCTVERISLFYKNNVTSATFD